MSIMLYPNGQTSHRGQPSFQGRGYRLPPFHRGNAKVKFNNYMCGVKPCQRHIKNYSLTQEMILEQQVGWSQSLEVLVPRERGLESIWQSTKSDIFKQEIRQVRRGEEGEDRKDKKCSLLRLFHLIQPEFLLCFEGKPD